MDDDWWGNLVSCAKAHSLLLLFPNSMSYQNLMTQRGVVERGWLGIMRDVAKMQLTTMENDFFYGMDINNH
ncbi:Squamosa promoter-binding protein 1 isoform D [Glycine soja]|uniref:Squamosa promoter-binding protein 1 isoform D n=1 Tax=Glycine soja TaxID=3848 RepID=A0A445JZ13_GLYSO|nr:Squamosa promoter-binding protein 1 isoform D [Glycine soja]